MFMRKWFIAILTLLPLVLLADLSLELQIPAWQPESRETANVQPLLMQPGNPALPFYPVRVLIPMGEKVAGVEVVLENNYLLREQISLDYVRNPQPASQAGPDLTEKNPAVWNRDAFYPSAEFEYLGTQMWKGYQIALLNVYPWRYNPVSQKLESAARVRVNVFTQRDEDLRLSQGQRVLKTPEAVSELGLFVVNPEQSMSYEHMDGHLPATRYIDPNNPKKLIIITSQDRVDWFTAYAQWKTSQGILTGVFTMESILTDYAGVDNPAKVRSFIEDAYLTWLVSDHPLEYVILAGDDEIVPIRGMYVNAEGTIDDWIPSDLYYGCLDGNWNADGDGLWGEYPVDQPDLYPEVLIGRFPAELQSEFQHIMDKTIYYTDNNTASNGIAIMFGEQLNNSPVTWGGDYKDEVADFIPVEYDIETYYERDGTYSASVVVNEINSGAAIMNHMGHANYYILLGQSNSTVEALTNTEYGFLYSQGCYPAAFDQGTSGNDESIAEHFVTTSGGLYAFIGNTRYGWYMPGSTDGPSQYFDRQFFNGMFQQNLPQLGKAMEYSLLQNANSAMQSSVMLWCYYEIVLFGDPSVSVKPPDPTLPTCIINAPADGSVHDLNSTIAVSVTAADSDGTITGVAFYINDVLQYTDAASPYSWDWNTAGYSGGAYSIKVIATDNDNKTATRAVSVYLLEPPDEGFETGNFSLFAWDNSSTVPWTVQSSEMFSGTYAAKSGAIGDLDSTVVSLNINVTTAGDLSFWKQVSSESGWDYLRFYIDGVKQDQWAGSVAWSWDSYPLATGSHTLRWTYYKDGSVSNGSDCAWLDHIIFPPLGAYYAPPTNLAAVPGNAVVSLSWQAPGGGTATGYKIYRDSSLLASTTQLAYSDAGVVNETTYSYYVTALYGTEESGPSNTVQATPSANPTIQIGAGTATGQNLPVEPWYGYTYSQSIYLQPEVNIPGAITKLQWQYNGNSAWTDAIAVYMGHTSLASFASTSSWIPLSGLTQVYSGNLAVPAAPGWVELTLDPPFVYNNADNLVIAVDENTSGYHLSGDEFYCTAVAGTRSIVFYDDYTNPDPASPPTSGTFLYTKSYAPNLKLTLQPGASGAYISVNPAALDYGDVVVGQTEVRQFSVKNTGNDDLDGTITTPTGYTVALAARSDQAVTRASAATRNTLGFSIAPGNTNLYDLTFAPAAAAGYNGDVVISSDALNYPTFNLTVAGAGYIPPTISIDDHSMYASLLIDEEGTDDFTITNSGTQSLTYSLEVAELRYYGQGDAFAARPENSGRSIAGSTLTLDAADYVPGSTVDWTFTVYNASTDNEWLEDIYVTFPAGVTVNSATNFTIAGETRYLAPDQTSGSGITINWYDAAGGFYGVIYPDETATATVNVTIGSGVSGSISLPYQIDGDIWGSEPHTLTGTLTLPQSIDPIDWLEVLPPNGSVPATQSENVTVYFSAIGKLPGTYEAVITVNSNDPVTPADEVTVTMVVNGILELDAPVVTISGITGGVRLDWAAVENATAYEIYSSTEPYSAFALLGSTSDLYYEITDVIAREFFYVTAVNEPARAVSKPSTILNK